MHVPMSFPSRLPPRHVDYFSILPAYELLHFITYCIQNICLYRADPRVMPVVLQRPLIGNDKNEIVTIHL